MRKAAGTLAVDASDLATAERSINEAASRYLAKIKAIDLPALQTQVDALYLAVIGLLGVALGALLRSTAGAIASLVGLPMLLPLLGTLLGSGFKDHIAPHLPNNAGSAIMATRQASDTLSPWAGFAVMCVWATAALAAAAYTLIRRDA